MNNVTLGNYAHLGNSTTHPSDLFTFPFIYFLLIYLCLWDEETITVCCTLDVGKTRIYTAAKCYFQNVVGWFFFKTKYFAPYFSLYSTQKSESSKSSCSHSFISSDSDIGSEKASKDLLRLN